MAKKLDVFGEALTNLGQEIVDRAVAHAREEEDSWERCKTLFSLAQTLGYDREAVDAMFGPAAKIPDRKALWYRRQKKVFNEAVKLGVYITKEMSQKEAEEAVAEARDSLRTPEQRQQDALRMFQRTTKGAMNAKVDGATIAQTLVKATSKGNNVRH